MAMQRLPALFQEVPTHSFSTACLLFLAVFSLPFGLRAQPGTTQSPIPNSQSLIPLSPEMAVEIGLNNSLGLEIQRNQIQAAQLNDTRGLAGMTPDVNLSASDNVNMNFTQQKFSNGSEINRNGILANGFNAGILLGWTLFDGQRMVSTKARFGRLTELEELRLRAAATDLTAQILSQYWRIWQDQAQIQAIDELIRSTEERRRLAQTRLELGLSSKQDLLQIGRAHV